MNKIHLYDKILAPMVTEKTTNLSEQNKIVFKVPREANKTNLKKNIEKIFKVNVTKINIINFYDQYILFAQTIGKFRFSNYDFDLINVIIKYKFITVLIFFLIIILIKLCQKINKDINGIFSILFAIALGCLLIFHQYYTLN